jgi:hypothetical protein
MDAVQITLDPFWTQDAPVKSRVVHQVGQFDLACQVVLLAANNIVGVRLFPTVGDAGNRGLLSIVVA